MSIYQRFCIEETDEKGALRSFSLRYPENFNFAYDVADQIAREEPDRRAMVWYNGEEEHIFTFEQIRRFSNQMAHVFQKEGIGRGDRVMLILKRHYEYWFAAIALHKLGAVMIPATHMLTVPDLVYRFQAGDVRAVVCTPQEQVPMKVKEALSAAGKEAKVWCVRQSVCGFENLTEAMKKENTDFVRIETKAHDPMMLYFTSGTTGDPKGVIHDHTYPLAHIVTAKYWQQAEDGGLHFTVAETGWAKASWGKLYGQWLVGSAVMVYDFDNFDPRQLVHVMNQYGVTSFCAPPTVYRYLVRKGVLAMPALRHASTAGEMLAPQVFSRFQEATGIPLCEGYGQTETTLLMGNLRGMEPAAGSMGTVSPLYQIELWGKDGKPVKQGEIGEVVVIPPKSGRQPGVFCGYLDQESQYRYVWRGGVYHTGDAAWQDENGRFWFHGRFDDIIKTGGFRVGPYEVEHTLLEHPAVQECSVIGVSDPLRGQAIKAVIVPGAGYQPSKELEQEIREFCNQKLAEYKWVRFIEFVEEMPKTISGKVKKSMLRAQAVLESQAG